MKTESVQSLNPFKSVIQTIYDIIEAHAGEVESRDEGKKRISIYCSAANRLKTGLFHLFKYCIPQKIFFLWNNLYISIITQRK